MTARPEGEDRHANKQQQILSENLNLCYPFRMIPIAPPPTTATPDAGNSLTRALYNNAMALMRYNRPKKKKRMGGSRNPLKRLISAKEIKGNPSFFLCKIWLELGPAWLDFAEFGVGFEK